MARRLMFSLSIAVGISACNPKTEPAAKQEVASSTEGAAPAEPATPTETGSAAAEPAGEAHVHSVVCGCKLEKKCRNMVQVNGTYIPLAPSEFVKENAFHGKQGLKAELAGQVKDGRFVASSFKLVEAKK